MQVARLDGDIATVKYEGPQSIATGISAAIRGQFPEIVTVNIVEF